MRSWNVPPLTAVVFLIGSCRAQAPQAPASSEAGPKFECGHSTPVLVGGQATGFARCDSGLIHRPSPELCPTFVPRSVNVAAQVGEAAGLRDPVPGCAFDADCTARAHGYCEQESMGFRTQCRYGCRSDADCSEGELCRCGEPVGTCVPATCKIDRHCAPGATCAAYSQAWSCAGGDNIAFACQTAADECAASCPEGFCTVLDGRRVCQVNDCRN